MNSDNTWAYIFFFTLIYVFLAMRDKLPSVVAIGDLISLLNSRGGNIFILSVMTFVFFFTGMKWFYYLMDLQRTKSISADNALLLNSISWITGAAFSGSSSALYSALTGQDSKARTDDMRAGDISGSSVTETTKTTREETKTAPLPTAPIAAEDVNVTAENVNVKKGSDV